MSHLVAITERRSNYIWAEVCALTGAYPAQRLTMSMAEQAKTEKIINSF